MCGLVLPAKIFEVKAEVASDDVFQKLKDFREEEAHQTDAGDTIQLVTEILDLNVKDGVISGIFSKDFLRRRLYRREVVESPQTEEAPFWLNPSKEKTYLIVVAPSVARGVKKLLTNHVANALSEALFLRPWAIVEVTISHEVLKELHEANPQATKLIWFDDVDIPSVDKLCLAGSGLADTQLYHDYLAHGKIWYVVFEAQRRGIVVGITRNCVITLFSKSTTEAFIDYLLQDFVTLIT